MKFGSGLFSMQSHPNLLQKHDEIYSNTLSQVELSEEFGFDSAWLSEHHFLEDGYCPSPLVMAAAMLARTSRIKVGTSIFILPLHNPVRVAEDAAVLDNISGGRFKLGVGIGYREEEFEGYNIPIKERASRFEESLMVIESCWKDKSFTFSGKYFNFEDLYVTPKPVQKPGVPILIGAFEEPAIRRAGRLGIPLMIGPGRTIGMIKDTLAYYNDEAAKYGIDYKNIRHVLLRETYINQDTRKARQLGEKFIINMYKFYFTLGIKIVIRGQSVKDVNDPLFNHLAEDRFIIGTPEYCRNELAKYKELTGIDYFLTRMVFPESPDDMIRESIKTFGETVISYFN